MIPITHEEIRSYLTRWTLTGHELFLDGTELIGKVSHLSPDAWLHELFAPPSEPNYEQLLHHIPNIFDFEIGKLLSVLNGINLFSSQLFIYGLRTSYRRDGSVFQPWDITTHHCEETHNLHGKNAIVFGGSDGLPDGICYVENSDLSVEAFDRNDWSRPMHSWPNLHDFVRAEVGRLSLLFDDFGKPVDESLLADFEFGSRNTN
jgi:hypothetical protein